MSDLRSKLSLLVPGDIIHGTCPEGASYICLVESIGSTCIETRRVTTQDHVTFNIETGEDIESPQCRLTSIAPLPVDVHNVLLGLDRKMRLGHPPLSQAEIDALLFVADFYPAHPL